MLTCDVQVDFRDECLRPSFATGEGITVLFGPSGAGKSVTLRALAGLIRPSSGRIAFDETVFFDGAAPTWVGPGDRHVGYVPQSLGIFPNMTVTENITFAASGSREGREERVRRLVALMGLTGLERRKPRALSGGQQQRVALARALARDARLLLLDEPFSALDEGLRQEMRHELLRLRDELALTIVFVTHDLREAHLLADRIAVLDAGVIRQFAAREEVFRRPVNRRVAELTGIANVFRGVATAVRETEIEVMVDGLTLRCGSWETNSFRAGEPVDVAIRAERVNLRRRSPDELTSTNAFGAAIVRELPYGSTHTLQFEPAGPGPALQVELAARPYDVLDVARRRHWTVELPIADLHVMAPMDSGTATDPRDYRSPV